MRALKSLPFIGFVVTLVRLAIKIVACVIIIGIIYCFVFNDFSAIDYIFSPEGAVIKLYQNIYNSIPELFTTLKSLI
jgi:hypothetical protein